MRYSFVSIFFLSILFAGCADKQVLANKTGSCKLELYQDSTYAFTYPAFIGGKRHENGTYSMLSNAILLKRSVPNTYAGVVDCSSGYYFHPDTLQFAFRDLNDSAIAVTFTLNQNPTVFKTDEQGHLQILYSELASKKIFTGDSTIHSISISFNDKTYNVPKVSGLPKPTSIEIKLNQFVGEKTVVLYRKFKINNDTVIVNGLDAKVIRGDDRRLSKK